MNLSNIVRQSVALLDPHDRRRYRWAVGSQILLAGMDLFGVLLIGLVGLLAASVATETAIPSGVQSLIDLIGLGGRSPATVAALLGLVAAIVLILKSVLSLLIQRKVAMFLANRVGRVAANGIEAFLSQSLLGVQRQPVQRNTYAFVEGLTYAITGVLGQFLIIAGDVAVLAVLGVALLIIDPVTTLVTLLYFGLLVGLLSRGLGRWAVRVNRRQTAASIESRESINDAVITYRESVVAGRREFFVQRYVNARTVLARAAADNMFLNAIPRFAMEAALVLGALVMVVTLLVSGQSLTDAVGGLALFLAAVARVMPSLLRLNAAYIGVHSNAAASEPTLELLADVADVPVNIPALLPPGSKQLEPSRVGISHVSLQYPEAPSLALDDVTLTIEAGLSVALVGPTGAGKSSLVDVVLGIVEPTMGSVLIDGLTAHEVVAQRAGALAYVPQNVAIVHGTVRDNVALGLREVDDQRVWAALERAHLADFVRSHETGLNTLVGERGVRMSGGQRQRLGLARALYAPPSLLVLDEATSSLDAQTERAITDTIAALESQVTTITIAHRLATIRSADLVVYMSQGRVVATGTFEEVRAAVPQFERQARLLGL